MNSVSKLSLASVAVLGAALFAMAPASGALENPRNIKARSLIGNNDMGFFTPAAASASLDMRWHLMMVTYEMFVYSVFAFL